LFEKCHDSFHHPSPFSPFHLAISNGSRGLNSAE
jgi:hypothetical protein